VLLAEPRKTNMTSFSTITVGNLMEKGLQSKDGMGVWILLVNSLTAGVVTYYWIAWAQLRQRSIAWRAAFSSSMLGGLMMFPLAAFFILKISPDYPTPGYKAGENLVFLLVIILLAAVISLFYGFFFLGLNAFAGGSALQFGGTLPVAALRILLGLIPVAAVSAFFIYLSQVLVLRRLAPENTLWLMDWKDCLHPFIGPIGWSLGLWLNPGFERVVAAYSHWKESPGVTPPAKENFGLSAS
jgi:hypothetical protein